MKSTPCGLGQVFAEVRSRCGNLNKDTGKTCKEQRKTWEPRWFTQTGWGQIPGICPLQLNFLVRFKPSKRAHVGNPRVVLVGWLHLANKTQAQLVETWHNSLVLVSCPAAGNYAIYFPPSPQNKDTPRTCQHPCHLSGLCAWYFLLTELRSCDKGGGGWGYYLLLLSGSIPFSG